MTWYRNDSPKSTELPLACQRRLERVEQEEREEQLRAVCTPSPDGCVLRAVFGRIAERLGEDRLPDTYEEAHGF